MELGRQNTWKLKGLDSLQNLSKSQDCYTPCPSDDVGAREPVKLRLLKHPIIPCPNWPEMNVYGAKESVCQDLGFMDISLGRNRWSRVPEDLSRDIGTDEERALEQGRDELF